MPISIPLSRFNQFVPAPGKRWGQSFYDFMQLHKITSTEAKVWSDRLYNAKDDVAKQMVKTSIDHRS